MQENLWDQVIDRLHLAPHTYDVWFSDLHISINNNTIKIHAPNSFKRDIIKIRYGDELKRFAADIFDHEISIQFLTSADNSERIDTGRQKSTEGSV